MIAYEIPLEIGKGCERTERNEYLSILSEFIGIEQSTLGEFVQGQPISYIFEYPEGLALSEEQCDKLRSVKKLCELTSKAMRMEKHVKIGNPEALADLLIDELQYLKKEVFSTVLLDTKMRIIKKCDISVGHLSSSLVHPREVMKEALKYSASSMVLVHNHPSGVSESSRDDLKITSSLMRAGDVMGIQILDHIIIGKDEYTSLLNTGELNRLRSTSEMGRCL